MKTAIKIFFAAALLVAATCGLPSVAHAQKNVAKPASAKPASAKSTSTKPASTKPASDKPEAGKVTANDSAATSFTANESAADKPIADESIAGKSIVDKSIADKPTADELVIAKPAYAGGFFKNFGLGVKVGTTGVGGDLNISLHPNIKARLGFTYLWYSYLPDGLEETVVDPRDNSEHSMGLDKIKLSFPNASLLVDLFPMRSGIFHFTLGLFLGQNKITAYGHVPSSLPSFVIADYGFIPNSDGTMSASLNIGKTVKPYVGIGLGRTITKRRVGFKFELGAIYQGKNLSITSNNLDPGIVADANAAMDEEDIISTAESILQLWPVMSFTLSFRIK
jgi:hypothetical protein